MRDDGMRIAWIRQRPGRKWHVNDSKHRFWGMALALFGSILVSCQPFEGRPKTAQEFIKRYSQAYREGDVETILKMTDRLQDQSDDTLRAVIQGDIQRQDFNYVAWTHTRYESEKDLGKCIRVEVRVDEAVSTVFLVHVGDTLKISQTPGRYEP